MAIYFRPKIIPQEQSIKKPFFTGLLFLTATLSLVGILWSRLPAEVPLFYSKPWGQQQLAQPIFLVLPILLCYLLLFVNSVLAQILSDYSFIRKVLIYGATTASILASITIIRIILLII